MKRSLLVGFMLFGLLVTPMFAAGQQEVSDKEVTLQAVWMGWPEEHVTPMLEMFYEENPNIKVNAQRVPFAEIFQTLDVRLNARTELPDVYMVDGPLTANYAARGHLLELEEVYGDDIKGFTKAAIDQGSYNGKLYSAPFASSSQLLFYNADLLKEQGIELPSSDPEQRLTWEEIVDISLKVTDPSKGIWGLVFEQTDKVYQMFPLPQSKGAKLVSSDGLEASGYVNSKEFVESMQFYQDLFQKWKISPVGTDINTTPEIFANGKTAFFVGGLWNLVRFQNDYPNLNWGVAPHPYFEGGKVATPTGSWHIGINPRTKNMEAAQELIKFLTTDTDLRLAWYDLRNYVPVRTEIFTKGPEDVITTDGWKIMMYEMANTAVPRPATPAYREYEDILMHVLKDLQIGGNVQDILDKAAREIDVEMEKYK